LAQGIWLYRVPSWNLAIVDKVSAVAVRGPAMSAEGQAMIVKPNDGDIRKAKAIMHAGGDYLTSFQRGCVVDATMNISVVQALRMIKSMCENVQHDFPGLCGQLKEVAKVMLGSPEAGNDEEELCGFFDLSPGNMTAKASPAIDDVVQAKCKQDEDEGFGRCSEYYYQMQVCITRCKGLVNMYYASVTAKQFSLANLFRDDSKRHIRLAALKVHTQAYLADRLSARAPSLKVVQDEKPLEELMSEA